MFVPVTYKRSRVNFHQKFAHGVLNVKTAFYVQRSHSNNMDGHRAMMAVAQSREQERNAK